MLPWTANNSQNDHQVDFVVENVRDPTSKFEVKFVKTFSDTLKSFQVLSLTKMITSELTLCTLLLTRTID